MALSRPGYAVKSLIRDLLLADERTLGGWTEVNASQIRGYVNEPLEDTDFRARLDYCERRLLEEFDNLRGATPMAKKIRLQYALVRAARPSLIVETGVASGISSAYFLLALAKNGVGRLVSIDLPDESYLPAGEQVGWVVPDRLREPWELRTGDSRELLPRILEEKDEVDLFVHDSLHTRDHILFELREAYPNVSSGGFLVCDDATWNTAFEEFCEDVDVPDHAVLRGVGFVWKSR